MCVCVWDSVSRVLGDWGAQCVCFLFSFSLRANIGYIGLAHISTRVYVWERVQYNRINIFFCAMRIWVLDSAHWATENRILIIIIRSYSDSGSAEDNMNEIEWWVRCVRCVCGGTIHLSCFDYSTVYVCESVLFKKILAHSIVPLECRWTVSIDRCIYVHYIKRVPSIDWSTKSYPGQFVNVVVVVVVHYSYSWTRFHTLLYFRCCHGIYYLVYRNRISSGGTSIQTQQFN